MDRLLIADVTTFVQFSRYCCAVSIGLTESSHRIEGLHRSQIRDRRQLFLNYCQGLPQLGW